MAATAARPISISYTSFGVYDECPQKWLFQYCKGHSYSRNSVLRLQRKLAPWATFSGSVIDGVIRRVLLSRRNRGKWPAAERVMELADLAVTEGLDFSSGWREATKHSLAPPEHKNGHQPLDRHFYSEAVSDEEIAASRGEVERCVRHFMDSEIRALIDGSPVSTWWEIKRPGQLPESFLYADAEVWVAPDLILERDGLLHIIDWKSGKSDAWAYDRAMRQMHWYAFYAAWVHKIAPSRILLRPVWLKVPDLSESLAVRSADLNTVARAIRDRRETLASRLHPVTQEPTTLDAWPMRPQARRCAECSFRGTCPGAAQVKADGAFAINA